MGLKNGFEKYLKIEGKSEATIKNYISAFSFINRISKENNLPDIEDWNILNAESFINKVKEDETFIDQNIKENNMYSASLNNYLKYMKEAEKYVIPPIKPFDNFKWRWAVTTPSEGINTPEVLIGTLKVLFKHNGEKHTTQEFKDDLFNLQNSIDTNINLAKIERPLNKNIIENSGQYWKALGLLSSSSGGEINLTDLGVSLANGTSTYDDFIKYLYFNFRLPNTNIESNVTIQKWRDNNIEIQPFKIILDILMDFYKHSKSPSSWYLTPEELKKVIIPLSIYPDLPTINFIHEIYNYRKNPDEYESWPNCTPEDNDFRMVKEYLLFLLNFGYLDLIELKDNTRRYYLNAKSIELFENKSSFQIVDQHPFNIKSFSADCLESGLIYSEELISRFVASLATKPFVLLTGLSGSGKTKLAQSFTQWICESKEQYCIVPVGADWTNREPLLGYVNALEDEQYILPENKALELIIKANEDLAKPYFLILDEMNLSHVERYFADFLSVMETKDEKLKLHTRKNKLNKNKEGQLEATIEVPSEIKWSENLFVIGTVNIDETTYMFSPKVLDRANVIEFRINQNEMSDYLDESRIVADLNGEGVGMAESFVNISNNKIKSNSSSLTGALNDFFVELQKVGFEFGYRTASEIQILLNQLVAVNPSYDSSEVKEEKEKSKIENKKIDIAIMQKLLPKLHGSRSKLLLPLKVLASLCYQNTFTKTEIDEIFKKPLKPKAEIIYPISLEKITRMYKNVTDNGFTSYAEA